jgi:hypothetical protein
MKTTYLLIAGIEIGLLLGCAGSAWAGPPRTLIPYVVIAFFAALSLARGLSG